MTEIENVSGQICKKIHKFDRLYNPKPTLFYFNQYVVVLITLFAYAVTYTGLQGSRVKLPAVSVINVLFYPKLGWYSP